MLKAYAYACDLASVLGEVAECHTFEPGALTWLLDWVLTRWFPTQFADNWRVDGFLTQDARGLLKRIRCEGAVLRGLVDGAGGIISVGVLEDFETHVGVLEQAQAKEVSP